MDIKQNLQRKKLREIRGEDHVVYWQYNYMHTVGKTSGVLFARN